MTTPTTASAAPAQAAHPAAPTPRPATPAGTPTDLFASLLALVAEAPALPGVATTEPAVADAGTETDDTAPADPLAALLAWVQPAPGAAPGATTGSGRPSTTDTLPALTAETRRLDAAPERSGAIELPASAAPAAGARAAAPAWLAAAGRPGPTATDKAPAAVGDIGLRWQRGASSEHAAPVALALRSTVTLGERALAPGAGPAWANAMRREGAEDSLPGASPTGGTRAGGDALAALPGAAGTGTGTESGAGDSATADTGHRDGTAERTDAGSDPLAHEATGDDAVEVSHWGSGALRNASLRVGEAGEQAIDIQLAVRGDEVQVDFRTDDAQARELLREQAGASLADLLQASGMQLGGVSVGAQGGDTADRQPHRPTTVPTVATGTRADAGAEPAAGTGPRTRADGGPALDLFI